MTRKHSFTKLHVLEVTETMLSMGPHRDVQIKEIAKNANVAVPTIYYHFDSLEQLIAEAQAAAYFKLVEPLHASLTSAEAAIKSRDADAFFAAVGENVVMAWKYGQSENGWKIQRMLLDVWSDPKTQHDFCEVLDIQIGRWLEAIEEARKMGWVNPDVDVTGLIATCWTGSIGQSIFAKSTKLIYTPESIRDFYLGVIGVKEPEN